MNQFLTDDSIQNFKKELEGLKRCLIVQLYGKSSLKDTEASQDLIDNSSFTSDKNLSFEMAGKEIVVLRQVERALEKIEENSYGICDITGKDIPLSRLEAIPYASMTIDAQKSMEKSQYNQGGSW